jgi:hypothetical protein
MVYSQIEIFQANNNIEEQLSSKIQQEYRLIQVFIP